MRPLVEEYVKDHSTEEIVRWIADNTRKVHTEISDNIKDNNMELLCYGLNRIGIINMMTEALAKKIGAPKSKVL